MAEPATYSVSTKGEVLSGFERDNVASEFSSVFGVSIEKASVYLQQQKLIKKDLSREDAETYQARLMEIGVSVVTMEHNTEGDRVLELKPASNDDAFSLVPDDQEPEPQAVPAIAPEVASGFSCPKCQLPQEKSPQCTGCGVFFEKLQANGANSQAATTATSANTSSPRSRAQSTARQSNVVVDEDAFSIASLMLPFAAAVVGAFVWKFIAVMFGYELGLVAWGIGGAIGAAAAMSGGRGEMTGIACAVLAVLAIFAGKYMIVSGYQSEVEDLFSAGGDTSALQELFEEVTVDAVAFSKISKDDNSIKSFMVQHDYSDAKSAVFVTDGELQEFKEYTQPWLEEHDPAVSDQVAWDGEQLAELEESFSELSTTSMVFESLEFMDILFIFLGISTAFQLGRAGRRD